MKPAGAGAEVPECRDARVAVVSARFYPELSDWLEDGAKRALTQCGVAPDGWTLTRVAGSFELPLATRLLVETGRYDALVALGVIVRGETPHFDFVSAQCARGIMDVQLEARVPIGFGGPPPASRCRWLHEPDVERGCTPMMRAHCAATKSKWSARRPG